MICTCTTMSILIYEERIEKIVQFNIYEHDMHVLLTEYKFKT